MPRASGLRALAALVDQLAGPRERPAWFGPSIARMLRQEDAVIAATGPRELEHTVTELTGAGLPVSQAGPIGPRLTAAGGRARVVPDQGDLRVAARPW